MPVVLPRGWRFRRNALRTRSRLAMAGPARVQPQSRTAAWTPISVASLQRFGGRRDAGGAVGTDRSTPAGERAPAVHEDHGGSAARWTESGLKKPRICTWLIDGTRPTCGQPVACCAHPACSRGVVAMTTPRPLASVSPASDPRTIAHRCYEHAATARRLRAGRTAENAALVTRRGGGRRRARASRARVRSRASRAAVRGTPGSTAPLVRGSLPRGGPR